MASDESDTEPYPFEDQDQTPIDEDLFDDLSLNNYSDSGPDMDLDEMSIGSTPKPVLRWVLTCSFRELGGPCVKPLGIGESKKQRVKKITFFGLFLENERNLKKTMSRSCRVHLVMWI